MSLNASPITGPNATAAATQARRAADDPQRFESTLHRAGQRGAEQEGLREAAGQLVASAFLLPLLEEVRNSPLKTDLFGGGFAQDAIQQRLDVQIADRVSASPRFPLVESLVEHLSPKPPLPAPMPVTPSDAYGRGPRTMQSTAGDAEAVEPRPELNTVG